MLVQYKETQREARIRLLRGMRLELDRATEALERMDTTIPGGWTPHLRSMFRDGPQRILDAMEEEYRCVALEWNLMGDLNP